MTARRIHPLAAFAALAVVVNFAVAAVAPLAATHPRGSLIAAGGLADLTIAIPALYYWLVVRTGTQPLITIAPVALLGYLKASWTFPGVAPGGAVVAGLCEIGVMAFIAHRVRRGVRLARGADGDVLARIGAAVFDLIPMRAAAKAAASEIAVFYYAFFSWRAKPEAAGFTIHRETGFVTLLGVVAVASIGEATGMHLVLRRWSHVAAWVLTALSVYGAIWIVALARSIVLRPVLVTADAKTGKDLWGVQTNASAELGDGHSWRSSPMTFEAGGKQFVAVSAGPNILCFGLK